MATINTTFGFQDQITQGLQHLNSVLAQLTQAMSEMNNVTKGVGDGLDSIGEKANNAADKTDDTLKTLFTFNQATMVFDTVTGAIGNVVGQMNELNGMYQAQMDSEARLSAVMGARMSANADDVQNMVGYIDEFSKSSAYNKTMLTNAAQELGTYIDKADTLKGLLPMLTSMSQQAGIANEQGLMSMATMIGKVMGGDMGGLSKRGWQFTESEKEAFKLMEEEEKLNFLVKTATENIGEQDKAISGMMANLSPQRELENLQRELGGLFGGFLDSLGKAQMKFQIFMTKTVINALNLVNKHPIVKALITGTLITAITLIGVAIAGSIIPQLVAMIGKLTVIAALKTAISGPFAAIGIAIGSMVAAYAVLNQEAERYGRINQDLNEMSDKGRSLIDAFTDSYNALTPAIRNSADEMGRIYENLQNVALSDASYNNMSMEFASNRGNLSEGTYDDATQLNFFRTEMARIAHTAEAYSQIRNFNWRSADLEGFIEEVNRMYGAGTAAANQLILYKRQYDELMVKADEAAQRIAAQNEALRQQEELAERIKESRQAALDMESDIARAYGNTAQGRAEEQMKELQRYKNMLSSGGYEMLVKNESGGADNKFINFTAEQMKQLRAIVAEMEKKLKTDGSGALITKDKGFVEISNDYRELLSKTATRRFNLAFKNVEPTVNVGGIVIQESADEGKIIQIITEAVTNVSSSSLDSESA